jgi:hypothetical protein
MVVHHADFEDIRTEIRRQYDLLVQKDESTDTKTGIMLGFIVIVITQLSLNGDFLTSIQESWISKFSFAVGLGFILYAGYAGFTAFFQRKFYRGVAIARLLAQYRDGRIMDYTAAINSALFQAYQKNLLIAESKRKYISRMMLCFLIGSVSIVLTRVVLVLSVKT